MKKLINLLVIICLIITLAVSCKDPLENEDIDYFYSKTNNEVTITGYNGSDAEITIPSTINGYSVTSIGNLAFNNFSSLTSVTVPDSVTSICLSAFYNCTELATITIPNSVTSIDRGAFNGCSKLTTIIIPDSVTSIGCYTFFKCTTLSSVTIPESVTSIGERAFSNCTSLEEITIPNSVTTIGDGALSDCFSLIRIEIESTTPPTLGSNAFKSHHVNLKIYVPSSNVDDYKTASNWDTYSENIYSLEE